jgi:hypothetical protein
VRRRSAHSLPDRPGGCVGPGFRHNVDGCFNSAAAERKNHIPIKHRVHRLDRARKTIVPALRHTVGIDLAETRIRDNDYQGSVRHQQRVRPGDTHSPEAVLLRDPNTLGRPRTCQNLPTFIEDITNRIDHREG